MARLSREEVTKRNEFVMSFVRKNKGATAVSINEALAAAFNGVRMRPQQVYKLKNLATETKEAATIIPLPAKTIEIASAGRKPGMFNVPLDSARGKAILAQLAAEAGLGFSV